VALAIFTDELSQELDQARLTHHPIAMISSRHPEFSVADAYLVQEAGVQRRLIAGESVVGGKLGFTSRAMQEAMGVDHPNYGWLTDAMIIPNGEIDLAALIHPKVEPEIAFLLAADLKPGCRPLDVIAATEAVLPCLEVVDSRFIDFRFEAVDNIADNSSAALVALGEPVVAVDLRLDLLGIALYLNGALQHTAAGAAALDHPAAAVAWMASHAPRPLRAGDLVISGGLTSPLTLYPGAVITAEFDRIGSVTLTAY
jgi:2-keto-4-pentenoate hydratase